MGAAEQLQVARVPAPRSSLSGRPPTSPKPDVGGLTPARPGAFVANFSAPSYAAQGGPPTA
eukprot:884523-Lingulodinium_polyedra.AAC.1